MASHIESAVACSKLLLQLSGVKPSGGIVLSSSEDMDTALKELSATYGVKLKQKTVKYAKLASNHLPIAVVVD
ncbi:hypothetical protein, partial [Candidatus Cardinium sp. cBcalN1]